MARKIPAWELKAQRDQVMRDRAPVAFRIWKRMDENYIALLVDKNDWECFECLPCVCADQAAATATHSGTRPLRYLGMFEVAKTERVPCEPDPCTVDRLHWTWEHHGHTHGVLDAAIEWTRKESLTEDSASG